MFIALLESAFPGKLGFEIETDNRIRKDAALFGEAQSRAVVSVNPSQAAAFEQFITEQGVPLQMLGSVTKGNTMVDSEDFGDIQNWHELYYGALEAELNS